MSTTPLNAATQAASGAPKTADTEKKPESAATASSDFQSFLKLLTAQLRNQDPMSPLDSTQFVEQLASFSAVEQQIETNKLLEDLTGGLAESGLEAVTPWIGKQVAVASEKIPYVGEPVELALPAEALGAGGDFVVRNAAGEEIYRETLDADAAGVVWDGRTENGDTAALAEYGVSIEVKGEDDVVASQPLNLVSRVTEIRLVEGAAKLVLESGAVLDPDSVVSVREPALDEAA